MSKPVLPWEPALFTKCRELRPPVPTLIALNRKPYRLTGIREIDPSEWDEKDWEAYRENATWGRKPFPPPEEWPKRPVYFELTNPDGTEPQGGKARIWEYRRNGWNLLPEHYAVCSQCGELSPCREFIRAQAADQAAERAMAKLERDLQVLPGCCWACQEVITKRQKWITFEGENVDLPGGPPVQFHTRSDCLPQARRYEERWAKLDPRRKLRLSCPGRIIYHLDGIECSEDPLCPGEQAFHPNLTSHRYGDVGICLRCKDARARMLGES